MRVLVIGGGVVGITTAHALLERGHEVCLVERNDDVGLETSFANGGQLSYRYVSPLADAGVPLQALSWMLRRDAPLRFTPRLNLAQWRWCLAFLAACRTRVNQRNAAHLLRLSLHSQAVLEEWRKEAGLGDFAWRPNGKLVIHRHRGTFDRAAASLAADDAQRSLSPRQCVEVEPALAGIEHELAGGIFSRGDEVADCHLFCQRLLERLRQRSGFSLRLNARVEEIRTRGGRVDELMIDGRPEKADHYVLAAGAASPSLALPLGIRLPIYPLKGYSLTAELSPRAIAPETNVTDYDNKTVFARLDTRMRIAAMVDIGGADTRIPRRRIETIRRVAERNFPGAADYAGAIEWAGCRPATPQGTPLLGASGYANLWLNVGHGSLGFTLACGSADIIGDLIGGEVPAISLDGLTLEA